ncbi:MAG: type VII toxin-antitoxin system MntA family adenylyltransferase antitoxin [Thermoanaerobaculum sp.]
MDTFWEAVVSVLAGKQGLWAVYAFGSRVRGDFLPQSDVDLAVLGETPIDLDALLSWQGELERALQTPVDLVDLRRVDAFMALEILKGCRLWAKDPVAADEFELYVLRRAGDLAFWERLRREQVVWGKKP